MNDKTVSVTKFFPCWRAAPQQANALLAVKPASTCCDIGAADGLVLADDPGLARRVFVSRASSFAVVSDFAARQFEPLARLRPLFLKLARLLSRGGIPLLSGQMRRASVFAGRLFSLYLALDLLPELARKRRCDAEFFGQRLEQRLDSKPGEAGLDGVGDDIPSAVLIHAVECVDALA